MAIVKFLRQNLQILVIPTLINGTCWYDLKMCGLLTYEENIGILWPILEGLTSMH
jgi:hypothetical protein